MIDRIADQVNETHKRAMTLAVTIDATAWSVWHNTVILQSADAENSIFDAVVTACVLVLATVMAVVIMADLRIRVRTVRALASLSMIVCFGSVLPYLSNRPVEEMGCWAGGTVGWLGTLLVVQQRNRMLGHTLMGLPPLVLVLWVLLAEPDAAAALRLLIGVFITLGIQTCVVVLDRLIGHAVRRATFAAQSEAAIEATEATVRTVEESRRVRFHQMDEEFTRLLADLAAGRLDPGHATVRRRCELAVSRMRRLLAESDATPTPLVHELRACADIAERRGVVVELATAGTIPDIPQAARRDLTDAGLIVLAAADTHARITVLADDDAVTLSVYTGQATYASAPATEQFQNISTDWLREGEDLWVQARWAARSGSPS